MISLIQAKSFESRGRRRRTIVTRLLPEACVVTIRGNLNGWGRPHINFEYVRYDRSLLAGMCGPIGQPLHVYFNPDSFKHYRPNVYLLLFQFYSGVNCALRDSMSEAK
ncbi:hypothetical protein BN2476_1010047 [Paraburkholderia piptadeniae]|uniref:Uncharacterized protein n=1 Tax=Paraburkholderia piptadeniae TaxID=1701573 RepID=A0A1N7SUG2_9BURK|nr:hypothetical protein BN2476_1010047 [Paraburkholderia piptadeniae]